MGALGILALTITLHGLVIASFFDYSPYDFNRHLVNFKNKNYQFWHQLYTGNFENQPFLRYSRPNYGAPPVNSNNNFQQWGGLNDVYGIRNTYNGEVSPVTESPTPKRTTRPRVTRTTKSRTTVSLSTEPWKTSTEPGTGTRPTKSPSELLQQIHKINSTSQNVLGLLGKPNNSTGPRPSKTPSQLLQQIQKVNTSAQNFLGQIEQKPQKPSTKDSVLYDGFEMNGVWTTARSTVDQVTIETVESAPIHVYQSGKPSDKIENDNINKLDSAEFVPILIVTVPNEESTTKLVDNLETTTITDELESKEDEMILISTSEVLEMQPESRHEEFDLGNTESTTTQDESDQTTIQEAKLPEETTDPTPEDLGDVEMNRQEEYELDMSKTTEIVNTETTTELPGSLFLDITEEELKSRSNDVILNSINEDGISTFEGSASEGIVATDDIIENIQTTVSDSEINFDVKDHTEKMSEPIDSEATTTEAYMTEITTNEQDDTTVDVTTVESESGLLDDLLQFLLLDILQAANALQNVLNLLTDPIGLGLNREFILLQTMVIKARDNGLTELTADNIDSQIVKITSSFALQRLRSIDILEKRQRLIKLGKLLKISVRNLD